MADWFERHLSQAASPPTVVDEPLFRFLVDLEIKKASRLQYCVSVVYFAPHGSTAEADPAFTREAAEVLGRVFRASDVASPVSPGWLGWLLVDAETQDLPQIFRRTAEELRGLRRRANGTPVAWSAGGGCFPLTAMNASDLLSQAADLTQRAREVQGGTLLLPV